MRLGTDYMIQYRLDGGDRWFDSNIADSLSIAEAIVASYTYIKDHNLRIVRVTRDVVKEYAMKKGK